ncbi:MAG: alpha/beta hydrolase fold domain-containing protein [Spartobacteria bacterium]
MKAEFLQPEETLSPAYQPPDGNILSRYRFAPPNAGPYNKYPTVLMFPPDVYKAEYGDRGVPSELMATRDLQYTGFLVFQVDHRLAPPGALPDQTSIGRAPDQTDDAKRQILAALADPQCNGSIYLIGGSAGGTLALWCALDSATGAVPGWNDTVRQKIKAVVSLSGITNLDNWDNPGGLSNQDIMRFENNLDNYVGLPDQDHTHSTLLAASPYNLVHTGAATSSPPVMLFATIKDTVPYSQAEEMATELRLHFPSVTITEYTLTDTTGLHAFNYWHTQNTKVTPSDCVSHQVITFLQANP